MDSNGVQLEAAQVGMLQRAQKVQGEGSLKLIDSAASSTSLAAVPPGPGQLPTPPGSTAPPVQPVSAPPRDGGSVHVIA